MKSKIITAIAIATSLLSACSKNQNIKPENSSGSDEVISSFANNVVYNSVFADYPIYRNVEELMSSSLSQIPVEILIGKVTDISFQMLDSTTGLPPTDKTEERHNELCTIYSIDVITSYTDNTSKLIKIRVRGGLKYIYVKEQLEVLDKYSSNSINIVEDMPEIKIGETYLFSLAVFEGTDPCLINLEQGIINIRTAYKKDSFGYISATDIISYFGENKLVEFENKKEDWIKFNSNFEKETPNTSTAGEEVLMNVEKTISEKEDNIIWVEKETKRSIDEKTLVILE
jgi:hypothetical protein